MTKRQGLESWYAGKTERRQDEGEKRRLKMQAGARPHRAL